jgi:MoaA/NifB/PqqE/SkfB family radical SAM enzyme
MKRSDLVRGAALASKIPMYWAFRRYGHPVLSPLAMSFVVTDKCNSLCKTCNIGRRYLDDPSVANGELALEEYAALAKSIGSLEWVTFSGGEPFMRQDFPDVVVAVAEATRPRVINVPTNATLVRATVGGITKILERLGPTRLVVNVSLDGVGQDHDEVRGFRGNFASVGKTVDELRRLSDPRLVIGANTVISRFNVERAEGIFDFVLGELRPDSYVVELAQIRPEYFNQGESIAPDPARARAAIDAFLARSRRAERRGVPRWVRAFRSEYYHDVKRELDEARGHRCFSAFATCSVMPHGEVWSNTQRADVLGDVRDFSLDFQALWHGAKAAHARERIRSERCHCETSNVAYSNALMSPAVLSRVFGRWVLDA